jgi:hypothetical protein
MVLCVEEIDTIALETGALVEVVNPTKHETSHIPAVRLILVTEVVTAVVKAITLPFETYARTVSPIKLAGGVVLVLFPFTCTPVESTAKFVVSINGTPDEFVTNTPLFAVVNPEITFAAEENKI